MKSTATALLVAFAGVASADEPPAEKAEPAALQAGEANLESTAARQGLVFTFAPGGAITLGFGVNDSTGTGGGASLRIARVATARSLVTLEIVGSALFHQVTMGMGDAAVTKTFTNQLTSFLVGVQAYANPALFVRVAGGWGRYFGDDVLLETKPGTLQRRDDIHLAGPAFAFGVGVEVLRWKRVKIGPELCMTGMINREGVLASGGFLLGISVD